MATINLGTPVYYQAGVSGVSAVIGYASSKNRVARFTFTSPAEGASHLSFSLNWAYRGDSSSNPLTTRFYVGTDPDEYANAGAGHAYTGEVTYTGEEDRATLVGEADIVLLPDTVYYLWLFPGGTKLAWWGTDQVKTRTLVTSGGAGVVYIDTGVSVDAYMPFVDNGSSFDQVLPNVDNGSSFELYT